MSRDIRYCYVCLITALGVVMLWGQAAGAQSTSEVNWVDGADRYEVAVAAVGGSCSALAGSDGSVELALATGENWPDALAASALDRPVLLTRGASLHSAVRRLVDGCPGAVDIVILGGTAAVSQAVQDELAALGASAQRIAGADRYETARKIAEFAAPGKVPLVYLATGANFADAISAAPRVTVSSPIVLTPKAALGPDASAFLSSQLTSNAQVVILGGTAAVSQAAEDGVRSLGLSPRRIAGPDRYATSALTANESLQDPRCTAVEDIAVASGTDPYGGLVAASTRGPCQPMLLAPPPTRPVPSTLTDFLQTWSATLNTTSTAPCRISMVGVRSTLGAQLLTDSASALQTAGCTPPTDNTDTQPPDTTDTQSPGDAEQFHDDAVYYFADFKDRWGRQYSEDTFDWWQKPRGDLSVNVHLCVQSGLESRFAQRDLEMIAQSYHSYIAPFYSWQSSNLLRVAFKAGDIMVSEDLTRNKRFELGELPSDCIPPKYKANVAYTFLVVGEDLDLAAPGWGILGGPVGVTFLEHKATSSELWRAFLARRSVEQRTYADIVEHEFDHNVGFVHLPSRLTRAWIQSSGIELVGSLHGYPDIERLRVRSGDGSQNLYGLFPCWNVAHFGWPTGDGHPACARVPHHAPENVTIERQAGGGVRLRWAAPDTGNPEPVTGYQIELRELRAVGNGQFAANSKTVVATYSVAADITSFILPTQNTDGTAYIALVSALSAVGMGNAGSTDAFVFLSDVDVNVTQVQSGTGSYGVQLSWSAAPGATNYQMTGIENCMRDVANNDGSTSNCFRSIYDTEVTLQHYDVVTGKSYDIEIFACNEGANLAPTDAPSDCYLYALVTVDLRTSTVHLIPDAPSDSGFILRAEWTPASQSVEYEVWAALCRDDQAPCAPLSVLQGWGYSSDSGTSSGRLLLDHGKRYWITVRACEPRTPQDSGFYRPNKCPVFAEAWYTVPAGSS